MLKKTAVRFHNRIYLEQLANNLDFNIGKETKKNMDKKILKNEDYPSEDVKTLNENIYGNLIAENIIHEVEETQTKDDLIEPKIVDKNTPKSFEDWLFKEPIPTTSREVTVDEILQSLENRKNQSSKTSFFSASDAAKKSLELNNDFVTETLAEIHVQQGNYPKAIEIYQKLMLLNPEKKLFFASRIEFINQKTKL
jgi:tetratricopeptide (TPR) repeat protein